MSKMEYLKNLPVAVLGGGAVGKTCAADIKLAGREVRLYDVMPFAEKSLKDLDKTGILFDGIQRNRDCFERSGRAFIDVVTSDIEKAIKGAGHIVVSCGSWGHEAMFRAMADVDDNVREDVVEPVQEEKQESETAQATPCAAEAAESEPVDEELNRIVGIFKLAREQGYTLKLIPGTPEENAPVFDFEHERILRNAE